MGDRILGKSAGQKVVIRCSAENEVLCETNILFGFLCVCVLTSSFHIEKIENT